MATTVVSLFRQDINKAPSTSTRETEQQRFAILLVTALTALAFFIHGYHPYAEDGGLYLTGIKKLLVPDIYPQETGFVVGHLRFSLFAPVIASLVRISGIRLEFLILLVYLFCTWMTLWAGWLLAKRCFQSRARMGAVALLAVWLTLPVAGTSLIVMDPYVTARSISTPCVLLSLVLALDFLSQWRARDEYNIRTLLSLGILLAIAALVHPLMAAYGFGCILALGASFPRRTRVWAITTTAFCLSAIAIAAILSQLMQPETADYRQVAMSRYYWFLSQWHWYEWLGLVGPMAILAPIAFRYTKLNETAAVMARMCITAGVAAGLVALIFARADSTSLLVARLQPLRIFQTVYIVMTLYVGAWLASRLRHHKWGWIAAFSVLSVIMLTVQRKTFPSSAHIEFSEAPVNAWAQAFVWIRNNTPKDAFFALDADYITRPGEDAQSFRAIAERSALPDYSKDGGEAAITPSLSENWVAGQKLQRRLSEQDDQERLAELRPVGVDWVVLTKSAPTAFSCAYTNVAVKVCQLPSNRPLVDIKISSNLPSSLHSSNSQNR